MLARIGHVLLALLLPPLGLWLWFGRERPALALSAAWLLGQLLFWFVFAGPGFLLTGVAAAAAAARVFLRTRSAGPPPFNPFARVKRKEPQ